jgi:hypothetical protein
VRVACQFPIVSLQRVQKYLGVVVGHLEVNTFERGEAARQVIAVKYLFESKFKQVTGINNEISGTL